MAAALIRLLKAIQISTRILATSLVQRQATPPTRRLPQLPDDILFNILVRLPTASLGRLKSVSKQWTKIISDPYFAKSHLAHQPVKFDLIHSLLDDDTDYDTFFFEKIRFKCSETRKPSNFNSFFDNDLLRWFETRWLPLFTRVYGSCKGLILTKGAYFCVVNLVTWESIRLPPLNGEHSGRHRSANIGFDSYSKKYKVVVAYFNGIGMKCHVLTLHLWRGTSAWRNIDFTFPVGIRQFNIRPIFAKGGLHWIHSKVIISMDLAREKLFQQKKLSFCTSTLDCYDTIFFEWDGCLAIVPKYQWLSSYGIFVLRESGWTKELEVDTTFFKHMCPSDNFGKIPPYPVTSMRDGKIIIFKKFDDHESFFLYHVAHKVITPFTTKAPLGRSTYLMNGYFLSGSVMAHVDFTDIQTQPFN